MSVWSNMSTSHVLIDLVEEITTFMDNNKYAIGILVGLKKAYDTANHDNNYIDTKIILLCYSWYCTYMEFKLTNISCIS